MSSCVIGVDGGGTSTRAVVLGPTGAELGRAEGQSAVADARQPYLAASAVAEVCAAAAMNAGQTLPVAAVWAGLAGAGREGPRSAVELELGRLGVAATVRVGTDVLAAFQDAFENGPGVLLISGTGSIAWGRAEDGREGRVGGWGQHIGDEGSGYAIGLEALRRIARHADGRGPETRLQRLVLEHLGLGVAADLIPWASEASRANIAELALVVTRAAELGDAVAGEILVQAVEELEGHVLAILESLGPWRRPPRIALAGGLLGPGGPLRRPMEGVVAKHQLSPVQRVLDPARGAAKLAQSLLAEPTTTEHAI